MLSLVGDNFNDPMQKLKVLTDAAKFDVACTSSGVDRKGQKGDLGSSVACGICHSFASDGRCISLLKVLLTNKCAYDCEYCVNRRSADVEREAFEPEELAKLTIEFYRRNYIEGLFLSSAVYRNPDYTSELLLRTLTILRTEYRFRGYIHVKAIPNANQQLIDAIGVLADRMSVNIEFPSQKSLTLLAPEKTKQSILVPMGKIRDRIQENTSDIVKYKSAPKFVSGGQSTQMIIGATPESDFNIINLSEGLYKKFRLKRVFYSAYIAVNDGRNLPAKTDYKTPLLREHRLYQADWLLRFYGFSASELLDDKNPNFNPVLDPKCNWAINHFDQFPVEVNKAPYEILLRVPGLGVTSAKRILVARRQTNLDFDDLKKLGVVLKRAKYFLTCKGKYSPAIFTDNTSVLTGILRDKALPAPSESYEQMSLFSQEDKVKALSGQI